MHYTIQHLTTLQFARRVGSDAKHLWLTNAAVDWEIHSCGVRINPRLEKIRYADTDRDLLYAQPLKPHDPLYLRNMRYSVAFGPDDEVLAVVKHSWGWESSKHTDLCFALTTGVMPRITSYISCEPGCETIGAALLESVCTKYGVVYSTMISDHEAPIVDLLWDASDLRILTCPVINQKVFGAWCNYPEYWGRFPDYAWGRLKALPENTPVFCSLDTRYEMPEDAPETYSLNGW